MLKWLFGGKKEDAKDAPKAPSYEEARDIAEHGDAEARKKLAQCGDLQPELLYYFATDKSPEVRRTVANNAATPLQADKLLAKDQSNEVRIDLAQKIGRLLPDLEPDLKDKAADMVFEVLNVLAQDTLTDVRKIVADEVRALDNIPKPIVSMLASDVEEIVAAPVLEFSPLLDDDDLIGLINSGMNSGALTAVARRKDVSEDVSGAIIETGDEQGVGALLENDTSNISEASFEDVARMSQDVTAWHAPLIHRPSLGAETIKKISSFLSASLLKQLSERNDLDDELKEELSGAVEVRLAEEKLDQDDEHIEKIKQKVQKLFEAKALGADAVVDALNEGDLLFVVYSLSLLSELPPDVVKKMFTLQSAKTVLAITWKSGFNMDVALALQRDGAKIPPGKRIQPSSSGGFPLSESDMEWQLDLL